MRAISVLLVGLFSAVSVTDDSSYQLYFWDGKDFIPGAGSPGWKVKLLGDVPRVGNAKAEGIAIVDEQPQHWRILVIYDGTASGLLVNVPRP